MSTNVTRVTPITSRIEVMTRRIADPGIQQEGAEKGPGQSYRSDQCCRHGDSGGGEDRGRVARWDGQQQRELAGPDIGKRYQQGGERMPGRRP